MKKEYYSIEMTVLSPIHIGCGEEYDMTEATVDEKGQALVHFDPIQLWKDPKDPFFQDFLKMVEKEMPDSMLNIARKTFQAYQKNPVEGRRIKVTPEFVRNFTEKILKTDNAGDGYKGGRAIYAQERKDKNAGGSNTNDLSIFSILRTAYTPEGLPYIPGSSIKGALRTGIFAYLAEQAYVKSNDKYFSEYRQWLEKDQKDIKSIVDFYFYLESIDQKDAAENPAENWKIFSLVIFPGIIGICLWVMILSGIFRFLIFI